VTWKVIYFHPTDFTFVCLTEITEFAHLTKEFKERDAVGVGGSSNNDFLKFVWRRDHKDLATLPH